MLTGQKIYHQSREIVESNRLFFRGALQRLVSKRQGGRIDPPPGPARTCYGKCPARARVKRIDRKKLIGSFWGTWEGRSMQRKSGGGRPAKNMKKVRVRALIRYLDGIVGVFQRQAAKKTE